MGRFTNVDPSQRPPNARAILRWGVWDRLSGRRRVAPPGPPAPRVEPDLDLVRRRGGPTRLTWIGHSSFLGHLGGAAFLIDPVFSRRVGWIYPRYGHPGLGPEDLPPVDAVMVTHNHYDHLDATFLRALPETVTVIVPRQTGRWLRRRRHGPVVELDWWESTQVGALHITLVPARHWSRRWILDTNRALWGGFVIEAGGEAVYHAGDTGWFPGFAEIGRRFPRLLAALLPVGAYAPAWFMEPNHMNPEQAGEAFLQLGARHMVPMHWGAFQLTDEPLVEPADRLRTWWQAQSPHDGRKLHVLSVGETAVLEGVEPGAGETR